VTERTWPSRLLRALLMTLAALVVLSGLPAGLKPSPTAAAVDTPSGQEVIVVLDDGADPVAAARDMGVQVTHLYRYVFTGFSGIMPAAGVALARTARAVEGISPDGRVQAESQTIPDGVARTGLPQDTDGKHLAIASPIDADIAILDTGVTPREDLDVAGGKTCVNDKAKTDSKHGKNKKDKHGKKGKNGKKDKNGKKGGKKNNGKNRSGGDGKSKGNSWEDDNGHGTHVAGIAAALDNHEDVVGVAPGARIWAVKVLDSRGSGSFGDVICGLDWVVAHKDTIDVVNLSLSGSGSEKDECNSSGFHKAICSVVDAGIPVVVAAGNQGKNTNTRVPASYDEVITVSAIGDSDGKPGGKGGPTCFGNRDDTFANYSNFGPDVDIAAPGDCILSLSNKGGLDKESGTSEASPHVAGAVAIHVASFSDEHGRRPTSDESRGWLLSEDASRPQDSAEGFTGDPDNDAERLLWLAGPSG
jgi:subtilisin family serine protease